MRDLSSLYEGLTAIKKPSSKRIHPEWLADPTVRRPSRLEMSVQRYLAAINNDPLEYEVEESKEGDCSTGCSCLLGPSSCAMCCGCLPPIKQSTGTKFMYSFFLVLSSVTAVLIHTSHVKQSYSEGNKETLNYLQRISSDLCGFILRGINETWIETTANKLNVEYTLTDNKYKADSGSMCTVLTKFSSELVYIIFITMALFHFCLALLTFHVENSRQWRAKIHNGFWLWKYLVTIAIFCTFIFNKSTLNTTKKDGLVYTWMYAGLVFASLFVIWKTIVLVHVAHQWSASWYRASVDTPSTLKQFLWRFSLVFIGMMMIATSSVGGYLLLEIFTQTESDRETGRTPDCMSHPCFQNRFFIVLILTLCVVVLFFSCFSCTVLGYQTRTPITGILRAGVVISNAIYLTFNAVNSQRHALQGECYILNVTDILTGDKLSSYGSDMAIDPERCLSFPPLIKDYIIEQRTENSTEMDSESITMEIKNFLFEFQSILAILANIVALLCAIRAAFASVDLTKQTKQQFPMFCCFLDWDIKIQKPKLLDIKGQDVLLDDCPELTYSYCGFHLIYACASQYLMMTTTGWLNAFRFESIDDITKDNTSTMFIIQASTTLTILFVYVVTLITPLFCPKQKQSELSDASDTTVSIGELHGK